MKIKNNDDKKRNENPENKKEYNEFEVSL